MHDHRVYRSSAKLMSFSVKKGQTPAEGDMSRKDNTDTIFYLRIYLEISRINYLI